MRNRDKENLSTKLHGQMFKHQGIQAILEGIIKVLFQTDTD